jgi:hypothetical protein
VLAKEEWERLKTRQIDKPGDPLPYSQEPDWREVSAEPRKTFVVKGGEHGVVRTRWRTQNLPLTLWLWWQHVPDSGGRSADQRFELRIPGTVSPPLRVYPTRVSAGVLPPGGSARAEFDVWSLTRDELNVDFTGTAPDPLFVVQTRPLTRQECDELKKNLLEGKEKIRTRVRCGRHVTVTVREQKDGRQMEQGTFFRKLPVFLDGFPEMETPGPEIIGRVLGDIQIGGDADHSKIKFPACDKSTGGSKIVLLYADAKYLLEPFTQNPPVLNVQLTKQERSPPPVRDCWELKVTLPPRRYSGTFGANDAVTLRITNDPQQEAPILGASTMGLCSCPFRPAPTLATAIFPLDSPRFVRIPIDGTVTGQ